MANITGCYKIGSPEAASLIGCGNVGCVIGAEQLGQAAGVWMKTRFYREGHHLCATVYSVAAGEPQVATVRVDLRPILRAVVKLHTELHAKEAVRNPSVGWSLKSMWKSAKKAASAIGKSKLVKGVAKVAKGVYKGVKAVAKSKITGALLTAASVFPLTAPFAAPALGAYAAANASITAIDKGKQVVSVASKAASLLTRSKATAGAAKAAAGVASKALKSAAAQLPAAAKTRLTAQAQAASKVTLSAAGKAAVAAAVAKLPPAARKTAVTKLAGKLQAVSTARTAAAVAQALPPKAGAAVKTAAQLSLVASPLAKKAAAVQAELQKPAVRTQMATAVKVAEAARTKLLDIQQRAATPGPGQLDAQKSAVIIDLVARNQRRLQAMSQASAGGLPGVLITPQGKLVRGRFRVQPKAAQGGLLYLGPQGRERGEFARVAGLFGGPAELESIAVNGDLPMDGVRVMAPGPAARGIGPYENVSGCGGGCGCASCS